MVQEYGYTSVVPVWDDSYIYRRIEYWLAQLQAKTVFELGCGNGHTVRRLVEGGFDVTAIESSESGGALAKKLCPTARIEICSVYDDLAARFSRFDAVVSIDVVEHLYDPKLFAQRCFEVLKPGGVALISTPYHGYLKNLAIALAGKWDAHHSPLWEHGHIKFFSRATLSKLFAEQGMTLRTFERLGRVPVLAKSMVGVFQKPL